MPKPEIGEFYSTKIGNVFKVISIDYFLGYAVIEWVGEDFGRTWNYLIFPEPLENKLTPLEIELL